MMIIHIVLFEISSSLNESGILKANKTGRTNLLHYEGAKPCTNCREICNDMLSLKGKCLHPQVQALYIVRSSGDIEDSTQGLYVVALLNRERVC
jgi:hypothetical protein